MRIKIPKSILARGVRWEYITFSRGSGQWPGGNPSFTGAQPPALLIPCMDGTCQSIYLDVPEELVRVDDYVRELRAERERCTVRRSRRPRVSGPRRGTKTRS